MPNYPQPDKFQVSQETLDQWLKTRKTKNDENPGFFSSTGFSKDQSWATLAIIIELIALFTTLYGSYAKFIWQTVNWLYFHNLLPLLFVMGIFYCF